MKTSEFDYTLPPEKIAQAPASPRDRSRLLICRADGRLGEFQGAFTFEDREFRDIADALTPNDFIVVNDAKVLPVRMLGKTAGGGGAEAVILKRTGPLEAIAILKMSPKAKPGLKLFFEPGCELEVLSTHEERFAANGETRVRFGGTEIERISASTPVPAEVWLERHGHVPLPPYISREDNAADRHTYQTVYANTSGSAAAPTAGFHFTDELLAKIKSKGVSFARVTLHVGIGTFRPIKGDSIEDHPMHEETFEISQEFVDEYKNARAAGKRIVAIGTTTVRTLESWVKECGDQLRAGTFATRAYIRPGYKFLAVDDLVTNFHLPRSTLLVLVAAAMGLQNERRAYDHALAGPYRFFSYGDAMFIRGS